VVLLLLPHRTRLGLSQPLQVVLLIPLRFAESIDRATRSVASENERLSLLAARLAVENARIEAATGSAGPAPAASVPLVRAPVISRDLSTFERYLVISRGADQGIRPGHPVLTPEGVVGRVVAAGPHQSVVQTLLAPESRIAVLNSRSRVPGLARPGGGGLLALDYAPKKSDFLPGDTLVTAGLGLVFPKGLNVGVVTEVPDRPDALFKPVTIRPFTDVGRVERVFVLLLPETSLPVPDTAVPGREWLENTGPEEVTLPDQDAGQ
jgi:rod shape-determining protein MreC